MPYRSHARILCSIWDDPDFQEALPAEQRLYMLLLSQDSLSNCGRLALTVKRWSNGCSTSTPADIRRALAGLDARRFVVVDEDTEEVLIRTFIRGDGIVKQPQMMKSALREALTVKSPRLRTVLAAELRKLRRDDAAFTAEQIDPGWEPEPDPTPETSTDSPIQAQSSLLEPFEQADASVPEACPKPDELRRGRGRGSSSSLVSSSSVVGAAKRGTRIPEDFTVTQAMVIWARSECPDTDGKFETAQFVDYWAAKAGAAAVKLDWTRTWQTWMRRAQRDTIERGPRLRAVPAPLISDDPATAFDDIRERGDALAVSRIVGAAYLPRPQPPSDETTARVWDRAEAQRFIDTHADALRAALTERSSA